MERTKTLVQKYKITMLFFFSIWLALTIVAPFTIPSGTANNLSGNTVQIKNWNSIDKMNPFAASIYLLGGMFCTEISDHSYYLNGNQMPFCARCTGIFIGLVVGMLIAVILNPKVKIFLIGLAMVPILIDGGLQLITTYQSTNPLRVATGLLAGIAVSLYLSNVANIALAPIRAEKINLN